MGIRSIRFYGYFLIKLDPWTVIPAYAPWSEVDALFFDSKLMIALGHALTSFLTASAASTGIQTVLLTTIVSGLVSALTWPIALMQCAYIVDNPWSLVMDRAKQAGVVLAKEVIKNHVHGHRPLTLVGYSMGARVIYFCCLELAHMELFGLVDSIYMIGTPISVDVEKYMAIRSVVSGRIVNAYSKRDWLLGFMVSLYLI